MQQFEVGDWVIITHAVDGPQSLCVVGRVAGPSRIYEHGITITDVVVNHDKYVLDNEINHNQWPNGGSIHIERLAGPEPAV